MENNALSIGIYIYPNGISDQHISPGSTRENSKVGAHSRVSSPRDSEHSTKELIAVVMNYSLQAIGRMIVVACTLCPFKVARMATCLEVRYHSPVTQFR
jgi:hypothetical protein